MEKTGKKRPWKSLRDFHFSHSFNNNKLDDRDHFLQNAKTSVASLRRLITPTRNADHDQPGTLINFIGIRTYSLNEINAALSKPEVPLLENSDVNLFSKLLNIKKHFYQNHPRFEAKEEEYSTSVFTQSELNSLAHTARVYGRKTAKELVDLTHQEPTWVIPNQGRKQGSNTPITYDLFFEGAPEQSRRILGKLVAEQFGVAIPLAGDAEYAAFANEMATHDLTPDELTDSDVRSKSPYSRV